MDYDLENFTWCLKCGRVYERNYCSGECPHDVKQVEPGPQLVSHKQCTCNMDVLMTKGCTCGGS
jgi:hypothetical protein